MRLFRALFITTIFASGTCPSRAQVSDVLSFMIEADSASVQPADSLQTTLPADSLLTATATAPEASAPPIGEILSFIAETPSLPAVSPFAPLDFISGAYSVNDYHATGLSALRDGSFLNSTTPHPGYRGTLYTPDWRHITSGFGYRARFGRMHYGIDVAMQTGDTVRAPLPGKVESVRYDAKGYGHYIVVTHTDGMETRYAHLSRPLVSPGEAIAVGQPIALSGSSGNSTGPHLHFETRYLGKAVDPYTVFDFTGPMTLLASTPQTTEKKEDTPARPVAEKKPRPRPSAYVIKRGDTLSTIAKKTGVTIRRICSLNNISTSTILRPGSTLRLR
ncbi:MAG: peptidoglycan DD-metalloendopeptidase family protein [Duncaniella sp.]|nr:peptidoglycan DD-metalloendopeptidase family protein [Duncaniella sp.]